MSFNILGSLQRVAASFAALSSLLPLVGTLVQEAETLFPNAGSGAEKLAWVQKTIQTFLTLGGTLVSDVEAIIPRITVMINEIVAAWKNPVPPITPPTP